MSFGWKISIAVPNASAGIGGAFVLADTSVMQVVGISPMTNFSGGAGGMGPKEGLALRQARTVQKTPLFRAPYQFVTRRFNLLNTFAFTVQRTFQSVEACAAFVRSHADQVPAEGELIIVDTSATGQCYSYLPNAVIDSVEILQHQEVGALTRYSIVAGNAWQSTP